MLTKYAILLKTCQNMSIFLIFLILLNNNLIYTVFVSAMILSVILLSVLLFNVKNCYKQKIQLKFNQNVSYYNCFLYVSERQKVENVIMIVVGEIMPSQPAVFWLFHEMHMVHLRNNGELRAPSRNTNYATSSSSSRVHCGDTWKMHSQNCQHIECK